MNIISQVQAQEIAAEVPTSEFSLSSFAPLILIFAIFYMLIIRPQNKKMKEHQALVNAVKKGDKVITNSGIIGTIQDIDSKEGIVSLEIAEDVVIKILKNNILEVTGAKKAKEAKETKNNKKK